MRTLVAKCFGVLFSVSAGLPVGKEGPMIHCGAIFGASVSQGRNTSTKTPFDSEEAWQLLKGFRSATEKRDFIAAGASAGVAAAFGAPVGGVLFALEEGATHWNVNIMWRCFFCAMWGSTTIAFWTTLSDGNEAETGQVTKDSLITFGSFSTAANSSFNLKEVPILIFMGCLGGLCGAGFNELNKHLTEWRIRNVKGFGILPPEPCPGTGAAAPRSGWTRLFEAVVVITVVSSFAFWMPQWAGDCKSLDVAINRTCFKAGYRTDARGMNECIMSEGGAWNKIKETYSEWDCGDGNYSPTATLFYGKPGNAIKQLFHNQDIFTYGTLFPFFIIYFCLACWTYGVGVPSGLFVPSLLTGSAFGRIFGEWVLAYLFDDTDPGLYALVGAAAFLAGMARITISLTVILMECSRSVANGLPTMISVLFAKWVADLFNVGASFSLLFDLRHFNVI